jgi:pSer/pThr/pTyr-binding forkhead associated (FHA) protein
MTQVMSTAPPSPVLRLVVANGSAAGRTFDLTPGLITVGRRQEAGVALMDPSVSQHHAVFRVRGHTVTIEDLGSTNGTTVNGIRIELPTALAPGDEIDVGSVQLRVE